jgi:hypothetical protein
MGLRFVANQDMDSRLRGNDTVMAWDLFVIPAKAGIHADTSKKLQENLTALPSKGE